MQDNERASESQETRTGVWHVVVGVGAVVLGIIGVGALLQPANPPVTTAPFVALATTSTIETQSTATNPITTTSRDWTTLASQAASVESFDVVQPVPAVIFTTSGNGASYSSIDLETGTTTRYQRGPHHPFRSYDGSVADWENRLYLWTWEGPSVTVLDLDLATVLHHFGPESLAPIHIENGFRVIPTWVRDGMWVANPGIATATGDTEVMLFSLADRQQLLVTSIEGNAFPVAGTQTGLVLNTEDLNLTSDGSITDPGSERIVHMGPTGELADMGEGVAIASSGEFVVVFECPEGDPQCNPNRSNALSIRLAHSAVELGHVNKPFDGTWMRVGGPKIPSDAMPMQTVSPDGSTVLVRLGTNLDVNGQPETSALIAVDLDTLRSEIVAEYQAKTPVATWSRDGRWIVVLESLNGVVDISLIEVSNPSITFRYENLIPDGEYPLAAG